MKAFISLVHLFHDYYFPKTVNTKIQKIRDCRVFSLEWDICITLLLPRLGTLVKDGDKRPKEPEVLLSPRETTEQLHIGTHSNYASKQKTGQTQARQNLSRERGGGTKSGTSPKQLLRFDSFKDRRVSFP